METGQPPAADQVTLLYRSHGMDLIRIAAVMLGSRAAAEDAVQDAFCGLFRRWHQLADPASALPYVRSAVMNQCRSELRRRARLEHRADRNRRPLGAQPPEQAAILGEEHRDVLAALRRLPDRQREVLILRYFVDLPEPEIAAAAPAGPEQGFPNDPYGNASGPITSFGDFMNWVAGSLDGAGSRGASTGTLNSLARHWTAVFVTCAGPIVEVWQRMQLAAQPGFVGRHASKVRQLDQLVWQLLGRPSS